MITNKFVDNIKNNITELQELKPGWSGKNSKKISTEAIKAANYIISFIAEYIDSDIDVSPATDGSVNLNWIYYNHDINIKFKHTGRVNALIIDMDDGVTNTLQFSSYSDYVTRDILMQNLKELKDGSYNK